MSAEDDATRDLKGRLAFDSGATLPHDAPPLGGPSSPAIRVGTRLGRYLLEDELGRGGMGVVYAALDPELDRKVAIKLLRTAAAEGTEGKSRLLREAQALARLAHPNVISVFDVGASGDEVFIAMELCQGGTLRGYQRGRPWAEIVAAYVQAGRGLAAAHAAGLVHRDFKPDNVLVGSDGRMRVTDFGLVRTSAPTTSPAVAVPVATAPVRARGTASDSGGALASNLTEAGAVMGTPMYMAPEQMTGQDAGPAADQFAFAVSLWQALYGAPPFLAVELPERYQEIGRGVPREPKHRPVPARLHRALVRALASDPAARWPSLDALLDALQPERRRRRWPWLVGGLGATLIAGAALALVVRGDARAPACADADAAGAGLWTARRAAVEQAFTATAAPFAASAFAFADARLGAWEAAWRAAARLACEDTRVRHAQSAVVLDQRQACLATRRHRVAALIDGLGQADRATLADIDNLLGELPRLEECADAEVLAGKAPRPTAAAQVAQLADVERHIALVRGRRLGGTTGDAELADADADADAAVAEAARLGYAPTQAEALITRAHIALHRGDLDGARRDLVDAAAAATRGGDRESLATAYLDLLHLDADARADATGAESWSQLAGAAIDALGGPPGKRADLAESRAVLAQLRGSPGDAKAVLEQAIADDTIPLAEREPLKSQLALVLTDAGELDLAEQLFDEIIPARTAELGADHPKVLNLRANRANLFYFRGDFARCRDAHTEILAARERVFGKDNASVAKSLQALSVCLNKGGQSAAALPLIERAVAIFTAVRGADHPDTLAAKSDLGGVFHHLGEFGRALAINQEILAARERTLGREHPDVAVSLVNTAIEAKHAGRLDEALAYHARALAIFERALGAEHVSVGVALINYGEALRAAGRPVDAIATFGRAATVLTGALGDDHVLLAHVWYGTGLAELARGRARVAVGWLERAVARRDRAGAELDRNEQAEARAGLARALIAAGGDHRRARALAEQALAAWRDLGDNFAAPRAELERWLATVPR